MATIRADNTVANWDFLMMIRLPWSIVPSSREQFPAELVSQPGPLTYRPSAPRRRHASQGVSKGWRTRGAVGCMGTCHIGPSATRARRVQASHRCLGQPVHDTVERFLVRRSRVPCLPVWGHSTTNSKCSATRPASPPSSGNSGTCPNPPSPCQLGTSANAAGTREIHRGCPDRLTGRLIGGS